MQRVHAKQLVVDRFVIRETCGRFMFSQQPGQLTTETVIAKISNRSGRQRVFSRWAKTKPIVAPSAAVAPAT